MSSEVATRTLPQEIAIRAEHLGKRYHVYDKPHHRLLQGVAGQRRLYKEFWAVRDANFEIHRGEAVGFIGRNGAGKSTLLQIVCGIVSPTEGRIEVNGRIAALLELGAGFNPEFTGRENVFIKGTLLGMSRAQLRERMPGILAFAEIGEHIDQPVKTYSSGMFVRLAFAVSVHCDPEILVIDEALSVGDVYFQRKCHRKIDSLREGGCTLLFVTHSTEALARVCKRGIVLEDGAIVYDGPVKEATSSYLKLIFGSPDVRTDAEATPVAPQGRTETPDGAARSLFPVDAEDRFAQRPGYNRDELRLGNGKGFIADFAFEGMGDAMPVLGPGEAISLLVKYVFREDVEQVVTGLQLRLVDGTLVYSSNTAYQQADMLAFAAGQVVLGRFRLRNTLLPGKYFLTLGMSQKAPTGPSFEALDRRMDAIVITVLGDNQKAHGVTDVGLSIEIPAT
jgi:lipopolysaccharide transport system ATP-binding protein